MKSSAVTALENAIKPLSCDIYALGRKPRSKKKQGTCNIFGIFKAKNEQKPSPTLYANIMSVKHVWMMYPINQWGTSCSSQALNAATCNGQPCTSDIVSVAVNMKPRTLSYRRTLVRTIVLLQSVREANTDMGTARPECANQSRPQGHSER